MERGGGGGSTGSGALGVSGVCVPCDRSCRVTHRSLREKQKLVCQDELVRRFKSYKDCLEPYAALIHRSSEISDVSSQQR